MSSILFESINTWSDLQGLIANQVRESDVLEYKGAQRPFDDSDRSEIAKDVSAFANASGGVMIYGIITDRVDKTMPSTISGILESNIETFDRVVNSQIRREIPGIRKNVIQDSTGSTKAMVVFVPQSEDGPHQSLYDKKYYRRRLSESVPMEHDLIELMFGKRFGPVLNLTAEIIGNSGAHLLVFGQDGFSGPMKVRLNLVNSGKRIARYTKVIALFPPAASVKLQNVTAGHFDNIDDLYVARRKQARQWADNIGVIHPGTSTRLGEFEIVIDRNWSSNLVTHAEPLVEWTVFADEMNPRTGLIPLELEKV